MKLNYKAMPVILAVTICALTSGCKHDRTKEFTQYLTDHFNKDQCSVEVWLTPDHDFFSFVSDEHEFESKKFPSELDIRHENQRDSAFPAVRILEKEGYITTEKIKVGYEHHASFDKSPKKELFALRITPTEKGKPFAYSDAAGMCLGKVKFNKLLSEEDVTDQLKGHLRDGLEAHEVTYELVWNEQKSIPDKVIKEIMEAYGAKEGTGSMGGHIRVNRLPGKTGNKKNFIYNPEENKFSFQGWSL